MKVFRSLVFNAFMAAWTIIHMIVLCFFLPFPRSVVLKGASLWARIIFGGLKLIVGLDYRVVGRENIPKGPVIFAGKHQSAWDTAIFNILIDEPAYIVKRELLWVPLYGAIIRKMGVIAVDRKAGAGAVKAMVRGAKRALADGQQIVIFPEGTRVAPGEHRDYLPGVAVVYKQTGVPVTPVALNSGLFWSRRSFIKQPGTITIEFLKPIPPGLDNREFLERLKNDIETATDRLLSTAVK
ncbi:MAG: acyl-phosphate glycerol 3-phosphate acyltransferase [Rhodospirillales bacterium RIFCSPLOWO2_12_FULL_58_28]|nr:MAG: acyl-phosphate glycerol 3-phosphate acyltransferase [Rhodospirillales bacterium RIFCSPLOWO2_02_FULL_58_16]OHC76934.1 MAG: acyl-phosphate glycerol 3-phosphate acyltransferase [Rhodospirillales bacterium RIFCSPLOWO2_12_FULL_58_28]